MTDTDTSSDSDSGTDAARQRLVCDVLDGDIVAEGGAINFLLDDGERTVDFAHLQRWALARGGQLAARGVGTGVTVGLVGPNEPEWLEWAWGIWATGGALVPLPAPVRVRDPHAYREQLATLSSAFGCAAVVAAPRHADAVPEELLVRWDETPTPGVELEAAHRVSVDDLALVMCTSGSTSTPKGIPSTHGRLARRFSTARLAELGVGVSWLPFFHALGFTSVTTPASGGRGYVLSAERFARDPGEWLRLITEFGATYSAGACSAWGAAVRAVKRRPGGVDLSSLTLVAFGMEMVDPDVLDQLAELGMRRDAMLSMYGLSEGGGTSTGMGTGVGVDEVDLERLVTDGVAEPAEPGRPMKRIASCGSATAPAEVRIVDADGTLPDRHVGEIQTRSPNQMTGYIGRPDSEQPFDPDGWLWTGDLGYLADGDLYVTGRSKEIIVRYGRNYHPEDLEWAAGRVEGVADRGAVAFAPVGGAEGTAVLVIETVDPDPDALAARVRAAVGAAVGLVPDEVVALPPGSIPRAANGKLQRLASRDAHARGELGGAGAAAG